MPKYVYAKSYEDAQKALTDHEFTEYVAVPKQDWLRLLRVLDRIAGSYEASSVKSDMARTALCDIDVDLRGNDEFAV